MKIIYACDWCQVDQSYKNDKELYSFEAHYATVVKNVKLIQWFWMQKTDWNTESNI